MNDNELELGDVYCFELFGKITAFEHDVVESLMFCWVQAIYKEKTYAILHSNYFIKIHKKYNFDLKPWQ